MISCVARWWEAVSILTGSPPDIQWLDAQNLGTSLPILEMISTCGR